MPAQRYTDLPAAAIGVPPPGFRMPAGVALGAVSLQVADLERSLAFYAGVIGFRLLERGGGRARLGVPGKGEPLLELVEKPGVRPIPRRGLLGLYHIAVLLPAREDLGRFVRHLEAAGQAAGASDHLFSEALYLVDPDGMTVEVYRDRPRSEWRVEDGQIVGGTDPLDLREVAEAGAGEWAGLPEGSVLGHIHLFVGDLARAEDFYHRGLGFDRVIWSFPGALFLSAGGYHHHVGVNTWAAGAGVAGDGDARLLEWTLVLPEARELAKAVESLRGAGAPVRMEGGDAVTADPWEIRLRLTASPRRSSSAGRSPPG